MKVRGLVNLITGGCSVLGLATARHLVSKGGKVVLLDVNHKAGADSVKELGSENSHFLPCDVTHESQVNEAYAEANQVFGDIRTYLNCAGILLHDTIIKEEGTFDAAIFKRVLDVNLFGSFLCTTMAARHLKKVPIEGKERGLIINSSSIAARMASTGYTAYSASKGGIEGMLLPIARELGQHKIRVMNIAPGLMITPMTEAIPQERKQVIGGLTTRGEFGEAEHFAQLVEAIITNGYLNATSIHLDDGLVVPHV